MAKILLLDIETSPMLAYMWRLYQELTSMDMVEKDVYILCWSAKWLGESKIMSSALIDFPKEYKKDVENDKLILEKIHKLLDEADIVIGHNAAEFDIKKLNARFVKHGMHPPSPYKVVDTCLAARRYFGFTSNKLNDLGKYLGVGEKVETGGFKLWRGCLLGLRDSWNKMIKYNKQDVVLLEKVYLKLLPYMDNHPNVGVYVNDEDPMCPNCSSKHLTKRGMAFTGNAKYQRLQCIDCGSWSRAKVNLLPKGKVKLTNR